MATELPAVDVVTVGLGAAAGVAVAPLAENGVEVVALEAGTHYTSEDYASDELKNNILRWMGRDKFNQDVPTYRRTVDDPVSTTRTGPMMSGVGGASIHYGTQSYRFMPWVFHARSEIEARYGANSVPQSSTLEDWPLTYEDLEPYYQIVEEEIGISGQAGNVNGTINEEGNVFEGLRQDDYPMPPLRPSGYTTMMTEAARNIGWHPYPGPAAINSVAYQGRPACFYHGFCQPNGCPHRAKGSTNENTIPRAVETGNLEIVTMARVTRIEVDVEGRATGVTYVKAGHEYFQPASVVILSAYTYENVRLLLLSTSDAFPNGLANNSGQVGLHYVGHIAGGFSGYFPGVRLNRYSGTIAQCTSIDDWNADNFDHNGLGFMGGGNFAYRMEVHPISSSRAIPPSVPGWGSAYKQWLRENVHSVAGGFLQLDTFPHEFNFLDLDPDHTDPLGIPLLRITNDISEEDQLRGEYVRDRAHELLLEAGAAEVWGGNPSPATVSTHAVGGTRMGNDPETSVVNGYGIAHEVPNLMVMGGSTFGSHGGHNPTLTIQALAWRNAEYLVDNWSSIAD